MIPRGVLPLTAAAKRHGTQEFIDMIRIQHATAAALADASVAPKPRRTLRERPGDLRAAGGDATRARLAALIAPPLQHNGVPVPAPER